MDLFVNSQTLLGLCVALGIGLLIGAERERRKDTHKTGIAAGIRTFAVVALLGAVSILLGEYVFVVVTLVVGGSALLAYRNTSAQEPGLTTELSLFLTCLLGGLAIRDAALAAGIGAVLALAIGGEKPHSLFRAQSADRTRVARCDFVFSGCIDCFALGTESLHGTI